MVVACVAVVVVMACVVLALHTFMMVVACVEVVSVRITWAVCAVVAKLEACV